MELEEKQKALQESSYRLLEERIETLMNNKNSQVQDFARAGGLLSYIQTFMYGVESFIIEYMQQVIGKVIKQDNEYYAELLNVNYKNIEDVVAKPLAWVLFDNKRMKETIEAIQKSKSAFKTMDKEVLQSAITHLLDDLKKHLSIGGDLYTSLSQDKNKIFQELPQRVALALWQLGNNEIVNLVMIHLLSLQQKDNADDDNAANGRQHFGTMIGESIHLRIAWRYFRDVEELKGEMFKSSYRQYQNGNFQALEQLSKPFLSTKTELEIGQKLLDLALKARVIKEYTKPNDEKNFNYFKLNPELLEKMNKIEKRIAYGASMVYKPMVIEPLAWKEMYGGGFLPDTNMEGRFDLSLIKASTKKDREALNEKVIPHSVLEAINHLQGTPFKVNKKILEVLVDYYKDISDVKKKNRVDFAYYRILREILSSDLYGGSKEQIEQHFKKTKYIKLREYELYESDKKRIKKALKEIGKSKRQETFKLDSEIYYEIAKYKQGFNTIIDIAQEILEFEQFYFVWRMDFRGRLYPQQTLLHPQAGDMPKSLLLFAKEKPLNEEGKKWFFVHGANCYGEVDKEIFAKRIAWVEEHHDSILSCAREYREEKFWKKAGDPFKFLAWCFEYARYLENPENFTTGIPIAIDGSNNGFQHITALLKDLEGAKKVNVLPSCDEAGALKMSDFYAEVAHELQVEMSNKVEEFEEQKEHLVEKEGLFYRIENREVFFPEYHLGEVSDYLAEVETSQLLVSQYYTTYLSKNFKSQIKFTKKELDELEKSLIEVERKVRKEIGDEDLGEICDSMVDELSRLSKRAKRAEKKGKLQFKKEKAFVIKEKYHFEASSFYAKVLEAGLVDRSFVKGPVMTESYGSSTQGKAKALLDKIESSGVLSVLDEPNRYHVALEITKLLEKALSSVSASPAKYKQWMKNYAKEMVKSNHPIAWKTPLGLVVQQVDFKADKVKVSIDKGRKVEFRVYTDKLDASAHKKGLSPNYIHSLDASHLMMTVNALVQRGITDIVTVHDSFATHANDIGVLSLTLREAFVALHKEEILPELCHFWKHTFGIKEKEIPYVDKEGFDLDEVFHSEYFFA